MLLKTLNYWDGDLGVDIDAGMFFASTNCFFRNYADLKF